MGLPDYRFKHRKLVNDAYVDLPSRLRTSYKNNKTN